MNDEINCLHLVIINISSILKNNFNTNKSITHVIKLNNLHLNFVFLNLRALFFVFKYCYQFLK